MRAAELRQKGVAGRADGRGETPCSRDNSATACIPLRFARTPQAQEDDDGEGRRRARGRGSGADEAGRRKRSLEKATGQRVALAHNSARLAQLCRFYKAQHAASAHQSAGGRGSRRRRRGCPRRGCAAVEQSLRAGTEGRAATVWRDSISPKRSARAVRAPASLARLRRRQDGPRRRRPPGRRRGGQLRQAREVGRGPRIALRRRPSLTNDASAHLSIHALHAA